MNTVKIQSTAAVQASASELFRKIAERDLLEVFNGIPLISSCGPSVVTEVWRESGNERIIFFDGSNYARQQFLSYLPERSFSIRVDNFTSKRLGFLSSIDYKFRFLDLGKGRSGISATYKFKMHSKIGLFLFKLLAQKYLYRHISSSLNRIVKEADKSRSLEQYTY